MDAKQHRVQVWRAGVAVRLCALSLTVFILPITEAGAAAYKWTDEQGKVHYSDSPPASRNAQKLQETKPPPTQADAPDARERLDKLLKDQQRLKEVSEEEREELKEAKEKRAKEGSANAENCVAARNHLTNLQRDIPLYTLDAKGERNYLGDAERSAGIARAKQEVDHFCARTSQEAMQDHQRETSAASQKAHCEGLKIRLGEMTKTGADAAGSEVADLRTQIRKECRL